MNSKKDIFRVDDKEIIERIAREYPALTQEESDRIYARICEKIKDHDSGEQLHAAVSGVELYRRPAWHRLLGIAAAFAAVAGIAGSTLLLHCSTPGRTDNSPVSGFGQNDRLKAAEELTDRFLETASVITGEHTVDHSEKKVIFVNYSESAPGWKGEDMIYSPVTDSRLASPSDVSSPLKGIVTEEYMKELEDNGGAYFSRSIDALTGAEKDGVPPTFKLFSGELYTIILDPSEPTYTEKPVITDSGDTDFIVRRTADDELYFQIVWDGTQWRINNIERNKP